MRNLVILILIILICFSCNGQDYSIETKHLDCLIKSSQQIGIDLNKKCTDFEKHLVESGVLADKSGDSYYQIYKQIENVGDINFSFDYSLLDSIKMQSDTFGLQDMQFDCLKMAEKLKKSRKYRKSKIYKLKLAMDSIKASGDINVSNIASTISRILSPKDFEHDYYKMTTLILLATTKDSDSGISRSLLPRSKAEESVSIKKRNILHVYITSDIDSVYVNGKKILIAYLSAFAKEYIISDSLDSLKPELQLIQTDLLGECYQSKLIISMQNEKETKYKTYIDVQNQLVEAYNSARNDMALKYFKAEFDMLTNNQQRAIKELIPMRISEVETK